MSTSQNITSEREKEFYQVNILDRHSKLGNFLPFVFITHIFSFVSGNCSLMSRQLDTIFVAAKLHQVSNMFKTPAISRRQIALKIAPAIAHCTRAILKLQL